MIELGFLSSPNGPEVESWHWRFPDANLKPIHSPGSTTPNAVRIREGDGWKIMVLCALRVRLGAEPGEVLIGGADETEIAIAKKLVQQLYKAEEVAWITALFGDKNTSQAIHRLLKWRTPNSKQFVGLQRAEKSDKLATGAVAVCLDRREAHTTDIVSAEAKLATEFGIAPWKSTQTPFVGRQGDLEKLHSLDKNGTRAVQIVAPGGQGKTSLVSHWLRGQNFFFWPFYRQGLSGQNHLPFWPFRDALSRYLGLPSKRGQTDSQAVDEWLEAIAKNPRSIVLDGCEVMLKQSGTGVLAYPELEQFIERFPDVPGAQLVITTRVPIAISRRSVHSIHLDPMKEEWIAMIFECHGINLTPSLRKRAFNATEGSPLLAHLLSSLAKTNGDPETGMDKTLAILETQRRSFIASFFGTREKDTGLNRMLYRHETLIAGSYELALLQLCSAFQRDADAEALNVLTTHVDNLKMGLALASREVWQAAADNLRRLKLVQGDGMALTLHPLVQNYFSDRLRNHQPDLWRGINRILYDHYKDSVFDEQPTEMPSLMKLLDAIVHGCQMGDPLRSYNEVAFTRFAHSFHVYPLNELGAVHEMVAGMDAIQTATTQIDAEADPKWFCGFANVSALSKLALGDYDFSREMLAKSVRTGHDRAWKSDDPELIGIILFALLHRLRLVGWKGDLITKGVPTLFKMYRLSESKKELLAQIPDPDFQRQEATDYAVAHIAEFLMLLGYPNRLQKELDTALVDASKRMSRNVSILPDLAARPHGELLVANGSAETVLIAMERSELQCRSMAHEFSNTIPYLHGLAALKVALQNTDRRAELSMVAKERLDEAVKIASDRRQFHYEAPARLARAEWAIAARDERQLRHDLGSVQIRAESLGWLPTQILHDLLMARWHCYAGERKESESFRAKASTRATFGRYQHPFVKPHIGRHGPTHLQKLASVEFE